MTRRTLAGLLLGVSVTLAAAAATPSRFSTSDLVRLVNLSDLDLSPDGEYVV